MKNIVANQICRAEFIDLDYTSSSIDVMAVSEKKKRWLLQKWLK